MTSDDRWPPEIEHSYERVRILGQGAFGAVWLAKAKPSNKLNHTEKTALDDDDDEASIDSLENADEFHSPPATTPSKPSSHEDAYVAIKRIVTSNQSSIEYASREIAILTEISHPNAIRCLASVKTPSSRFVVLSLADGPNLQCLLDAGGALSVSLARLAARHLIAAVSYLHGRGVIHRDIKPDNCILMKAQDAQYSSHVVAKENWMNDGIFWDDTVDFSESEWKIVLVDFGFAKALKPQDVGRRQSVNQIFERQASQHGLKRDEQASSTKNKRGSITKKTVSRGFSFERVPIRAMSAVGTRDYAAPEVMKVRDKSSSDEALTDCVSDYGFISDSYSVGSTIKVVLTGVPADVVDIMGFMSANNNPLLHVLSLLFSCGKKNKRRKRYKFLDEMPKPARELIGKLMKPKVEERLAVPLARDEPWIKGGCDENDPVVELPEGDVVIGNSDPVVCLKCAVHH